MRPGWGHGRSILSWEPIPCTSVFTLGLYGFTSHKTNFGLRNQCQPLLWRLVSKGVERDPCLGKGGVRPRAEEAGAVTKSKGWGNSCLPESPWGSGCFPPCALFACLFRPCETLTCIETVVKSCCAHQQAAYPGLGGQVQRSCPCLPPPVPPLCPLHLPCPLRHLCLLLLLIRWLKNSYNLMGSL